MIKSQRKAMAATRQRITRNVSTFISASCVRDVFGTDDQSSVPSFGTTLTTMWRRGRRMRYQTMAKADSAMSGLVIRTLVIKGN